jgi:hypothetical protein
MYGCDIAEGRSSTKPESTRYTDEQVLDQLAACGIETPHDPEKRHLLLARIHEQRATPLWGRSH